MKLFLPYEDADGNPILDEEDNVKVYRNPGVRYGRRGTEARITLTTDDIAYILGISITTLRKYISNKRLPLKDKGVQDFYTLARYARDTGKLDD